MEQVVNDILDKACDRLEEELRRSDGASSILVVGERRSGKTTVCETVIRRLNRHIVRWTPYEDFVAGHVSQAYSGLDTIVFVDDADVLVRLTKGSSMGLLNAMEACKLRPRIRIVMTALETKGRVWKSVTSHVGVVQFLDAPVTAASAVPVTAASAAAVSGKAKGKGRIFGVREGWETVLQAADRAVASKLMRNWCDARDADEDGGGKAGDVDIDLEVRQDREAGVNNDAESGNDGSVIRKIAHMLMA